MGLEQRARILVVDDEKAVRGLIERVLSDAGYEVVALQAGSPGSRRSLREHDSSPARPIELGAAMRAPHRT